MGVLDPCLLLSTCFSLHSTLLFNYSKEVVIPPLSSAGDAWDSKCRSLGAVISPPWKSNHVSNFFLCLWASLFFFVFFLSVRAFRLDETTHLESHRRFASTKHQFFENRLKHVNPLAFYAERGFHNKKKNTISSNPDAFYVDLGAAASTKHTILKNPKGTSKGAPRDAQGTPKEPKGPKGVLRAP